MTGEKDFDLLSKYIPIVMYRPERIPSFHNT
jgi:hypothetical protein